MGAGNMRSKTCLRSFANIASLEEAIETNVIIAIVLVQVGL